MTGTRDEPLILQVSRQRKLQSSSAAGIADVVIIAAECPPDHCGYVWLGSSSPTKPASLPTPTILLPQVYRGMLRTTAALSLSLFCTFVVAFGNYVRTQSASIGRTAKCRPTLRSTPPSYLKGEDVGAGCSSSGLREEAVQTTRVTGQTLSEYGDLASSAVPDVGRPHGCGEPIRSIPEFRILDAFDPEMFRASQRPRQTSAEARPCLPAAKRSLPE